MHALGDRAQALGAVVDGVHRRDDGEQGLRGADVARRLLATDVLLTGLQGKAVGGGAVGVHADPDQTAGQLTLQPAAHRHEGGVRAAAEQRHTEPLRRADRHVGAEVAGRHQHREGQQVRGHGDQRAALVRRGHHRRHVVDPPRRADLRDDDADQVAVDVRQAGGQVRDHQREADPFGTGARHRQ